MFSFCFQIVQALFIVVLVPLGILSASKHVAAQTLDFRGTLESDIAFSTKSADLQHADFIFRPELRGELGAWGTFTVIGQARIDLVDKLEPAQSDLSNEVRGSFNQRVFSGSLIDAELREAYADIYVDDLFMRVGKQQVVWGQADGLRVLDAVNPLHYRTFIVGDFEQRRIPLWMLNVEHPIGNNVLQFLWIPDKTYDDIPMSGTFSIKNNLFRPFIPNTADVSIENAPIDKPNQLFTDDDYGLRLSGFNGGWDWAINYLFTYDDSQVLRRQLITENTFEVRRNYERTHMFGGSASNAFGKITLRTEVGWFSDQFILVDDFQDVDGVASTGEFSYILGIDYQPSGNLFLSAQLFQSILINAPQFSRRDETETNLTLLARQKFLNDSIEAEMLFIMNANNSDGLIQFSLERELTDAILIGFGIDWFFGKEQYLFGQFNSNDQVRLLFSYGF